MRRCLLDSNAFDALTLDETALQVATRAVLTDEIDLLSTIVTEREVSAAPEARRDLLRQLPRQPILAAVGLWTGPEPAPDVHPANLTKKEQRLRRAGGQ